MLKSFVWTSSLSENVFVVMNQHRKKIKLNAKIGIKKISFHSNWSIVPMKMVNNDAAIFSNSRKIIQACTFYTFHICICSLFVLLLLPLWLYSSAVAVNWLVIFRELVFFLILLLLICELAVSTFRMFGLPNNRLLDWLKRHWYLYVLMWLNYCAQNKLAILEL